MFGPDVNNLSGRNILIGRITGSNAETQDINQFKSLFDNTAVNLTEIPIEEHDQIMLYSLTISHLLNLIMGLVITKSPYSLNKLNLFSSTTFQKQLRTMIEVFEEDPKLYHAIQHINVYREDLFLEVQEAIINLQRTTKSTDPTNFSVLIQEVLNFIEN
jgi:prephenate dehydrogenase